MSHIDRALTVWERTQGVASHDAMPQPTAATTPSALQQFAPERQPPGTQDLPRSTGAAVPAVVTRPDDRADTRPESRLRPEGAPTSRSRKRPASLSRDTQARLVTQTGNNSVSLEQYRRLAAVLHDEQIERHLKTMMITSALPRDGKTLTLVNLALTLSESYARRVLVVDADLRGPSLHTVLNIPNETGLSEALRHDHHDPLHLVQVSERLTALTAGKPGHSPLATLTSSRMKQVLDECAERFDWVLIDTPPVGVLTDAQVLARLVGAVIFVIGAGSTPADAVERAIAELGGPDAITGIVLNRMDERRIPQADYYGQYYPTDRESSD